MIQVYLRAVDSTLPRPSKELAGFARVSLDAGEVAQVDIPLEPRVFAVWDAAAGRWVVEGGRYDILVGTSSVELHDQVSITVDSADTVTPEPHRAGPVATDAEFAELLGGSIPEAEGPRPFRRTSTVTELAASRLGRMLGALMRRQMNRMIPSDDDGTMRELLDGVIRGMPLRGMATMGQGLTLAALDRLIAALNGQWLRAVRGRWDAAGQGGATGTSCPPRHHCGRHVVDIAPALRAATDCRSGCRSLMTPLAVDSGQG